MTDDGIGDARLGLLVRDCWPRLVRTAYLLTGSLDGAEALVQRALPARLDGWRNGGAPADAGAELRDAVVRDSFRDRALYRGGSAPFADSWAVPESEPVRQVLRGLPLDERAVLVLRFWEHLDRSQATEVLRVPRGVVTEREARGLQSLRAAGLVGPVAEPRPAELAALLGSVLDPMPVSAPPDVTELLGAAPSRTRGRRVLLVGAVALAVAVVASRDLPL